MPHSWFAYMSKGVPRVISTQRIETYMLIHKLKRFGQHFFSDTYHRNRFVETALSSSNILPGQGVIWDMGAGSGLLAVELMQRGYTVYLFECDHRWLIYLREKFAQQIAAKRCYVVAGDMCKTWQEIPQPSCIISNFPFNVGIPFIMEFTEKAKLLVPIHAVLQKELINRICASKQTKDYGTVSVYLQMFFRIVRRRNIPQGAFSPPPRVVCASVGLIPYDKADLFEHRAEVLSILKAGFAQRRKLLKNKFQHYIRDVAHKLPDRFFERLRAEELDIDSWKKLCRELLGIRN